MEKIAMNPITFGVTPQTQTKVRFSSGLSEQDHVLGDIDAFIAESQRIVDTAVSDAKARLEIAQDVRRRQDANRELLKTPEGRVELAEQNLKEVKDAREKAVQRKDQESVQHLDQVIIELEELLEKAQKEVDQSSLVKVLKKISNSILGR